MQTGFQIPRYASLKQQGKQFGLAADAFILLKEKIDLKLKVEATLSQLFDRELMLSTDSGYLRPTLRKGTADPYNLKQQECHGLKELICLFTFLYDDENDCLIIDEPELHLHPQYQAFFLQQIRHLAGDPREDPTKKCFFLVTHSPYFVDIRTPDDLRHCVVFHPDAAPTFVDHLDGLDLYRVKRLLPRLNTHHKQFFFASRPIFVEGYTDQQLFTLVQEKRQKIVGAGGDCFIDVSGKDEMDLFFRLCQHLKIDARFIADLDVLFGGNLRQSVSGDDRCANHVQKAGIAQDAMTAIGKVEQALSECCSAIEKGLSSSTGSNDSLAEFKQALSTASTETDNGKAHAKKRYITLLAIQHGELQKLISNPESQVRFITGRFHSLIEAFARSGVHLLPNGQLENYLPSYNGNRYVVKEKWDAFEREREWLLSPSTSPADVEDRYRELAKLLDSASESPAVDVDLQLNDYVSEWIHKVQMAFTRKAITNAEILQKEPSVQWTTYARLFDLLDFRVHHPNGKPKPAEGPSGFSCRIKLKPLVDPKEREVEFNNRIVPCDFRVPD